MSRTSAGAWFRARGRAEGSSGLWASGPGCQDQGSGPGAPGTGLGLGLGLGLGIRPVLNWGRTRQAYEVPRGLIPQRDWTGHRPGSVTGSGTDL
jgi:hypothetical protein